MVRIDTKRKLLAVYDVLVSLHPDTQPETVRNTFSKFLRTTSTNLPRVHLLFKESSSHHTHTFPAISAKDRPKPQPVFTSYAELHDFLSEYNSLHPKVAERINAFLDENREQLQGIWGPEPKSCFALKTTVFPSQPHHVLQAFHRFGTIPQKGSTPGLWKAVIPAALLTDLVEQIGLCTDVAFLRKSSNLGEDASLDEEGNHLHAYYRCYRRDHVKKVDVKVAPIDETPEGVPHHLSASTGSTSEKPKPTSEGTTCSATPSTSEVSRSQQRAKKTRKYTHTCTTGCLANISAKSIKGNTTDVKGKCTAMEEADKVGLKRKDKHNVSTRDMLEVTLDLRHVGHNPDEIYEVTSLPLLSPVRNQYLSLAQVGMVHGLYNSVCMVIIVGNFPYIRKRHTTNWYGFSRYGFNWIKRLWGIHTPCLYAVKSRAFFTVQPALLVIIYYVYYESAAALEYQLGS